MFTRKKTKKIFLTGVHAICSLVIALTLTFSPFASPRPPEPVEAAGMLTGISTEITQLANVAQNQITALEARIQTGLQGQTAMASVGNFLKENVLDGIGWTIAKTALSSIIRSLINWVNSGFQGSPAFIQDLKQHLLGVLDEAAGEFIRSLGSIGEFICSPFRLDVQAALAINYQQARTGMPAGGDRQMCRISEIGSNIENFFAGMSNDMSDWLRVTSNPQNTPMGAYFAAEASLNARLINEAGQEIEIARWGQGFLSQRVCETTEGGQQRNCRIVTPGQVIADQINGAVGAGRDVLIEADEINELIGALLNQLVLQVMGGINGLLGLSQNSGGSGSYVDRMVDEMSLLNIDLLRDQLERNLEYEQVYLTLVNDTIRLSTDLLDASGTTTATSSSDTSPQAVERVRDEAEESLIQVNRNITELNSIKARIFGLSTSTPATTTAMQRAQAATEYRDLVSSNALSTEASITARHIRWSQVIPEIPAPVFRRETTSSTSP